jgi:curved DNA-binding protein
MHYKDYYRILGVPRDATRTQIEDAYLRGKQEIKCEAEDIVSAIRERDLSHAYSALSVPATRKAYDELGVHRPGEDFLPSDRWMRRFGRDIDPRDLPQDIGDVFAVLAPMEHVNLLAVPMHQPAESLDT